MTEPDKSDRSGPLYDETGRLVPRPYDPDRSSSRATRYYQAAIAMDGGELSAGAAKRIADFILGELSGRRPAVVVAEIRPLAGAPLNFPVVTE